MISLTYSEILKKNYHLSKKVKKDKLQIKILSNITVDFLKEILEYNLRTGGVSEALVSIGNYNNIVQESSKFGKNDIAIIFWDFFDLLDGVQFKIENLNDREINSILNKTKTDIDIVINNLSDCKAVIFNKFTCCAFSRYNYSNKKIQNFVNKLNDHLENKNNLNLKIIDLEKIILNIGIKKSIDFRFYYSSNSPYTIDFFKEYTDYVSPIIFSLRGKSKKAIVLDCDNTIWSGIVAEDGLSGIDMSKNSKIGKIFYEIQNIIVNLSKSGVLIGLNSKNNFKDVEQVLNSHKDIILKKQFISIKKINWESKVQNLIEISKELNIGLDSLIFVDDSEFEINLVKKFLPDVKTVQVPKNLYEYPEKLNKVARTLYNFSNSLEDKKRSTMYKQQTQRNEYKKKYFNLEEYLSSLDLELKIEQNQPKVLNRLSQLSQKVNQFNLTTKRYTEKEISSFIKEKNVYVFSINLTDKFGDYGITGLSIVFHNKKKSTASIDTLLMSCRIIGRNVEYVFIDYLVKFLKNKNVKFIKSLYSKNEKNKIVKNLYTDCGFKLKKSTKKISNFELLINNYKFKNIKYIKIIDEKN